MTLNLLTSRDHCDYGYVTGLSWFLARGVSPEIYLGMEYLMSWGFLEGVFGL